MSYETQICRNTDTQIKRMYQKFSIHLYRDAKEFTKNVNVLGFKRKKNDERERKTKTS